MRKVMFVAVLGAFGAVAQVKNYTPVTKEMLLNPPASDWLMFSRTYDGQRFSPLNQINSRNVAQLRTAWTRGIGRSKSAAPTASATIFCNRITCPTRCQCRGPIST